MLCFFVDVAVTIIVIGVVNIGVVIIADFVIVGDFKHMVVVADIIDVINIEDNVDDVNVVFVYDVVMIKI